MNESDKIKIIDAYRAAIKNNINNEQFSLLRDFYINATKDNSLLNIFQISKMSIFTFRDVLRRNWIKRAKQVLLNQQVEFNRGTSSSNIQESCQSAINDAKLIGTITGIDLANLYILSGKCFFQQGQMDKAKKHYSEAIASTASEKVSNAARKLIKECNIDLQSQHANTNASESESDENNDAINAYKVLSKEYNYESYILLRDFYSQAKADEKLLKPFQNKKITLENLREFLKYCWEKHAKDEFKKSSALYAENKLNEALQICMSAISDADIFGIIENINLGKLYILKGDCYFKSDDFKTAYESYNNASCRTISPGIIKKAKEKMLACGPEKQPTEVLYDKGTSNAASKTTCATALLSFNNTTTTTSTAVTTTTNTTAMTTTTNTTATTATTTATTNTVNITTQTLEPSDKTIIAAYNSLANQFNDSGYLTLRDFYARAKEDNKLLSVFQRYKENIDISDLRTLLQARWNTYAINTIKTARNLYGTVPYNADNNFQAINICQSAINDAILFEINTCGSVIKRDNTAKLYNVTGICFSELNDYVSAKAYFKVAYSIFSETGNAKLSEMTQRNIKKCDDVLQNQSTNINVLGNKTQITTNTNTAVPTTTYNPGSYKISDARSVHVMTTSNLSFSKPLTILQSNVNNFSEAKMLLEQDIRLRNFKTVEEELQYVTGLINQSYTTQSNKCVQYALQIRSQKLIASHYLMKIATHNLNVYNLTGNEEQLKGSIAHAKLFSERHPYHNTAIELFQKMYQTAYRRNSQYCSMISMGFSLASNKKNQTTGLTYLPSVCYDAPPVTVIEKFDTHKFNEAYVDVKLKYPSTAVFSSVSLLDRFEAKLDINKNENANEAVLYSNCALHFRAIELSYENFFKHECDLSMLHLNYYEKDGFSDLTLLEDAINITMFMRKSQNPSCHELLISGYQKMLEILDKILSNHQSRLDVNSYKNTIYHELRQIYAHPNIEKSNSDKIFTILNHPNAYAAINSGLNNAFGARRNT